MGATEHVLSLIRREHMLPPDCAVVAGVSGGADSVVLLHILRTLLKDGAISHLEVVHVNHNLRGAESLRDQRFVEDLCQKWAIPVHIVSYDVAALAAERKAGLEETGRELRYAAFAEAAERFPQARIATAHTADDNAETLLLHLCRGSGLHGAAGIPPTRGNIIRPLLTCTREEIEQYCAEHALSYVTDSTNADMQYARNRIRLQVMPSLREINPKATAALARFVEQARQADTLLAQMTERAIDNVRTDQTETYDRKALLALPEPIRSHTLHRITETGEERHIRLLSEALQTGSGSVVLPTGACWDVTDDALTHRPADAVTEFSCPVMLDEWMPVGDTAYQCVCISREEYEQKLNISKRLFANALDYDKICGDLIFRNRRNGDRFHPVGRQCGKSLKKLFNEEKTPNRDGVPVLCDDNGIVFVYGFGCDERVRITSETKTVLGMIKRGEES